MGVLKSSNFSFASFFSWVQTIQNAMTFLKLSIFIWWLDYSKSEWPHYISLQNIYSQINLCQITSFRMSSDNWLCVLYLRNRIKILNTSGITQKKRFNSCHSVNMRSQTKQICWFLWAEDKCSLFLYLFWVNVKDSNDINNDDVIHGKLHGHPFRLKGSVLFGVS